MATNGVAAQQALAPVLAAVETMQGNVDRARKEQAVQFLDKFQKTVRCAARIEHSPGLT
jgi:transportin-3